ncbi:MAG: hypothetical protein D3923_16320 [Candidatus Electrothrix sp. AR3]|nr:hypothetical protein [Candidatus Electrothrix sp. AR3]
MRLTDLHNGFSVPTLLFKALNLPPGSEPSFSSKKTKNPSSTAIELAYLVDLAPNSIVVRGVGQTCWSILPPLRYHRVG